MQLRWSWPHPRGGGTFRRLEVIPHEAAVFGRCGPVGFEHCGCRARAPAPRGGMQVERLEHLRERHPEVLRRSANVVWASAAEAPFGDDHRAHAMNTIETVEPTARPATVFRRA